MAVVIFKLCPPSRICLKVEPPRKAFEGSDKVSKKQLSSPSTTPLVTQKCFH